MFIQGHAFQAGQSPHGVSFQNSIGVIAVIIAAVMAGIGFFWLRRMMTIEV